MDSVKFRNKVTGEIVTQVPISDIANYEKVISEEAQAIIKPEWEKMQNFLDGDQEKALKDIHTANNIIRRKYKYFCGIVPEARKNEIGCGDLFFESPDGQNCEFYYALRKLGWLNAGYMAEYYWRVRKGTKMIEYIEGDVYIRNVEDIKK